jgi:hypothetical protein
MNYQRIYDNLILYRQKNPATGYTEKHHILMRSMGGSDDPSNLVVLTGREHWIAHLLLYKIHKNKQTVHACHMMAMRCKSLNISYIKNSRMYERVREEHANFISIRNKKQIGDLNSQYGSRWICNIELQENKKIKSGEDIPDGWVYGRDRWSESHIRTQVRVQTRTKKFSDEYYQKMRDSRRRQIRIRGWKHSENTKDKMSKSKLGNKSHTDKIWITDGNINKTISKNEDIPDGFRRGMKHKDISKTEACTVVANETPNLVG